MYRFFEKIRTFMYGRYGIDKLGKFLLAVYFIFAVINVFLINVFAKRIFFILQWLLFAIIIFRILSRNILARQKENQIFQRFFIRIEPKLKLLIDRIKNISTKRYRTCPNCRAVLRLPINRGKRFVKCPKCNVEFKVFILI